MKGISQQFWFCIVVFAVLSPATLADEFEWPLRCPDGSERGCLEHIGYPDLDGDGIDSRCQAAYSRGHTGVDLVPYVSLVDEGIEVRAAAAGRVVFTQTSMFDECPADHEQCRPASKRNIRPGFVGGYNTCTFQGMFCDNGERACFWCFSGNFVVIKHAGDADLYTAYLHLKKDSVQVKPWQEITAGQVLGLVGSSGESTRAHLHFEVWQDELFNPIEPWGDACGKLGSP